jgi:hypothetical protein
MNNPIRMALELVPGRPSLDQTVNPRYHVSMPLLLASSIVRSPALHVESSLVCVFVLICWCELLTGLPILDILFANLRVHPHTQESTFYSPLYWRSCLPDDLLASLSVLRFPSCPALISLDTEDEIRILLRLVEMYECREVEGRRRKSIGRKGRGGGG